MIIHYLIELLIECISFFPGLINVQVSKSNWYICYVSVVSVVYYSVIDMVVSRYKAPVPLQSVQLIIIFC